MFKHIFRNSAAISEWFESMLYAFHKKTITYKKDKMVDLEALTTPILSKFLANYDSMIELKSVEKSVNNS